MLIQQHKSQKLATDIKLWGEKLGFAAVGITDANMGNADEHLQQWCDKNYHADMDYMTKYGTKRSNPVELMPEVKTIICCAMSYVPVKNSPYIARFALGYDYHKEIKQRLKQLAQKITAKIGEFNYRCFVDTAPMMEKALAVKAGIGWQGKNSIVLNKDGSWFCLGEIFTDLKLPIDKPQVNQCNDCDKCIKACPTGAIVAPQQIDARRCIAYLTIENKSNIATKLTNIYGCDACQLACPWNKIAIDQSNR